MSRRISESGERICDLCSETFSTFAIGKCDHVVCYKCSTRMRVLCEHIYCPICRADLPKVVFMNKEVSFKHINTQHFLLSKKHNIYFENEKVQTLFHDLLLEACQECEHKPFRNFSQLKDHYRKEHTLFFCELCVDNLKIFTFERRFYDRRQLALHRRNGDPDNRSYRGHPLCEFCDERFFDNDELLRHLRKEHYYCHFCEADGITNQYYSEYDLLRQHFQNDHFLCEEEDCINEEFTNAFKSEIDLIAHVSSTHCQSLKKAAARQARTLDVDILYGNRTARNSNRRGRGTAASETVQKRENNQQRKEREELDQAVAISVSLNQMQKSSHVNVIDRQLLNSRIGSNQRSDTPYQEESQDFPTLSGKVFQKSNSTTESITNSKPTVSDSLARKLAKSANFNVSNSPPVSVQDEEFPSLGGNRLSQKSVSKKKNNIWKNPSDDFPVLGANSSNKKKSDNTNAYWKTENNKSSGPPREIKKITKKSDIASNGYIEEEFPSLHSKVKSVDIPVAHPKDFFEISSICESINSCEVKSHEIESSQAMKQKKKNKEEKISSSKKSKPATKSSKTSNENASFYEDKKNLKKQDIYLKVGRNSPNDFTKEIPLSQDSNSNKQNIQLQSEEILAPPPGFIINDNSDDKNCINDNCKSVGTEKLSKDSYFPNNLDEKDFPCLSKNEVSNSYKNNFLTAVKSFDISEGLDYSESSDTKSNKPKVQEMKSLSILASKLESDTAKNEIAPCNKSSGQSREIKKITKKLDIASNGNIEEEFPSLHSKVKSVDVVNAQTHEGGCALDAHSSTSPPPGFNNNSQSYINSIQSSQKSEPPPGFSSVSLVDSSLDSFHRSLLPSEIKESSQFINPINFDARNKKLICDIQNITGIKDSFNNFVTISKNYRKGVLSADDYYSECIELLSIDKFQLIFSELLVLLPDIIKQKELLISHKNYLSKNVTESNTSERSNISDIFQSCYICGQVLFKADGYQHYSNHNFDMQFPSLGN